MSIVYLLCLGCLLFRVCSLYSVSSVYSVKLKDSNKYYSGILVGEKTLNNKDSRQKVYPIHIELHNCIYVGRYTAHLNIIKIDLLI